MMPGRPVANRPSRISTHGAALAIFIFMVISAKPENHSTAHADHISVKRMSAASKVYTAIITAYAVAQPENERLCGYRMLALYRSGRRTEALSAYRHITAILADGYGIDPGPDLQRLHQQILTDRPSLR